MTQNRLRIVVLDANYPHDRNLYGDVFVHVRVARYLKLGHDVRVIVFFTEMSDFTFDGVSVKCAPDLAALNSLIVEFNPDVVAVHFYQGWMLRKVFLNLTAPVVVWVHGMEAMGWYRRLFNFRLSREFWQYVKYGTIQIVRFAQLVRYANANPNRVRFVFVSRWMKRIAEKDSVSRIEPADVIPNPVDTDRFPYFEKDAPLRTKVLLVRSFDSRKYANDIAVEAICRLADYPEFRDFQFSINGRGRLFASLTGRLRGYDNVTLHEGFLTQTAIRELHAKNGVMLCPTRQDAQGVSMCEAMSSGLVPITSDSTAIPEFVTHAVTGFLTDGPDEIVDALRRLHRDPELFLRMSAAAADDIRQKCAIEPVVEREIGLLAATAVVPVA